MQQKRRIDPRHFELWNLIGNSRDMIYRLREKELVETCGLSIRESMVLISINDINLEGKEATPAELARRTLRKPNTTAYLLDRMEKRGLINQSRDLDRKNLIKVTVTEKGKQAHICSQRREVLSRIMECLSDEEIETLKPLLQKYAPAYINYRGKAPGGDRDISVIPVKDNRRQIFPLFLPVLEQ